MRRLYSLVVLSILVLTFGSPLSYAMAPGVPAPARGSETLSGAPDSPAIPPADDIRSPVPIGPDVGQAHPMVAAADAEGSATSAPAPAAQRPKVISHIVAEGDTLWDIAEQYGVELDTVLGANPDISPNAIKIGQVVRVPSVDGALHKVKAGDTVSGIAAKYKVSEALILLSNGIADASRIVVGQELIIPGAKPVIQHRASMADGSKTTVTAKFQWPVVGPISSRYGWRWGRFHQGIDIAVTYGRTIVAARAGKVIFSGWRGGYGYGVIISHGDGLTTLYGHASRLLVSYGEWVEAGQAIARVGSTGNSTGPHCHFEVRLNGNSLNPLDVLP